MRESKILRPPEEIKLDHRHLHILFFRQGRNQGMNDSVSLRAIHKHPTAILEGTLEPLLRSHNHEVHHVAGMAVLVGNPARNSVKNVACQRTHGPLRRHHMRRVAAGFSSSVSTSARRNLRGRPGVEGSQICTSQLLSAGVARLLIHAPEKAAPLSAPRIQAAPRQGKNGSAASKSPTRPINAPRPDSFTAARAANPSILAAIPSGPLTAAPGYSIVPDAVIRIFSPAFRSIVVSVQTGLAGTGTENAFSSPAHACLSRACLGESKPAQND